MRLLLHPKDWRAVRVGAERLLEQIATQGMELLQAEDGDIGAGGLLAVGLQFIINLAGAQQDALDGTGRVGRRVGQDSLEPALGQLVQSRDGLGMAQEALGGHDDERFAPRAKDLAPQAMKILRRRARIDHLDVVVHAQHQEAFQAGAGVLGSLALEAMGQEQDQPAEPLPFLLGAGNELVHDRLRHVPEIAELRLP